MNIENLRADDQRFIDGMTPDALAKFTVWFDALNAENLKRTGCYYNGVPLEDATGIQCWEGFYIDGYEPSEALDEDLTCAW